MLRIYLVDILRQEQTVTKNVESFVFDTLNFVVREIGEQDCYRLFLFCFFHLFSLSDVLS